VTLSRPPAANTPAQTPEIEAEWIASARAGDREAFGKLVELHQDAVMTIAYRVTGHRDDAEDVAQQAFLKAFRSITGFTGRSSFRTWLITIATNTARTLASHRRALKRSGPVVRIEGGQERDGLDPPSPKGREDPEEHTLRVEFKAAVEGAIASLDAEARAAVVMRDLAGESYDAIAAALDLPVGTVKSRIHRARLELREKLKKYL